MSNSPIKSAREFAEQLYKFTEIAKESYAVKQTAQHIPLEFIRLTINSQDRDTSTVIAAFHLLDVTTGGIGDEFYSVGMNVPSREIDMFINSFKIPQVESSKTRKDRFVDYYLNGFQGTYEAITPK